MYKYFIVYNYTKGAVNGTSTGQFVTTEQIKSLADISSIEHEIVVNEGVTTATVTNFILMDTKDIL